MRAFRKGRSSLIGAARNAGQGGCVDDAGLLMAAQALSLYAVIGNVLPLIDTGVIDTNVGHAK